MTLYEITFQSLGLLVLFLIQFNGVSANESPIVNTTLGYIRGLVADDGDYYMYMGIPYAHVNQSNPFGKAIPQEPFDEVFDAIDDSSICPQIEEFNHTLVGNIDCMHINIYAPSDASPTNLKSVMVMIFGGGFSIGFAGRFLYGPRFLVRYDVVFVTLNYRLGPYGFMCLGTPECPGNEGFKDQVLALRWIKENIEAFGGDPNKITAFGNSAGAISVDYHLVSPIEKLFDQIILQSGSTLSMTTSEFNENAPFQLASYFGFVTDNLDEAIAFLAEVDELEMINAVSTLGLSFGPCIERQFEGVEAFITEDWMLVPIPKLNNMPVILGITNDEMINSATNPIVTQDGIFLDHLGSRFRTSSPEFEDLVPLVRRYYLGDEELTFENRFRVVNFRSDNLFGYPLFRVVPRYLNNEAGDLYFFMFSYVGQRNFARFKNNITIGGAAHADELGYLFDGTYFVPPNADDQLFIDRLTTLWTNFAKFGNPTPERTELIPVIWEPIRNLTTYHYLNLDLELSLGGRPFHKRMSFWDLFYTINADFVLTPTSN